MGNSPTLPTCLFTRKGSVGAGETILLQLFLPPGLFRNDGDQLRITSSFILAVNANSKANNTYFNGTSVAGRVSTDSGLGRLDVVMVTRISPTSAQAYGVTFNGPTATVVNVIQDAIVTNFANPIEVKMSGTGVADNDLVSRFLKVEYLPVGDNYNLV